jgi:outer membrane protein insertion porin family
MRASQSVHQAEQAMGERRHVSTPAAWRTTKAGMQLCRGRVFDRGVLAGCGRRRTVQRGDRGRGEQTNRSAAIRSHFHAGRDGRLDAEAIDAALKELYASGQFDSIDINHAGGRILVRVVEAAVLQRVAFEGNKRLGDNDLNAFIKSRPQGSLLRATVQGDVSRILEAYRHSGRYDVRVVPKIIARGKDRVDLVFEVSEGPKITVRQISFAGNQAFGASRLKGVIRTTETNLLSFLKSADVYDPDRIEADRDLLRRFYLSKGYADVSIRGASAAYDAAGKGFEVTFTIDEGPLYRFGDVDVVSNVPGLDAAGLRELLTCARARFSTVPRWRHRPRRSRWRWQGADIRSHRRMPA